ncbi:MAG: beta-lactamase family protein, partial [Lachnospiraceae bacterium]|nr:beta-lactamase family protein [Lachnospiraceae bacterium]
FYYITLYPAGMCTSTLEDFEKFAAALLREDTALLKHTETWETLFTPSAYYGESGIPLNCHGFWMVPFGVQTFGHGGNTVGCSSYLLLDREDHIGVVVMTNQSGEKVYNRDMMELIFGKYERSNYTDNDEIPFGGFRTTRTVRKGPFKVMSLSYGGIDAEDERSLWIYDDSGKRSKIVFAYEDQIQTSLPLFLMEVGLVFLWIAAFGFLAVSLLVHGIVILVRRVRGKAYVKKKLGLWSTAAALLQLNILLFLILVMYNVSHYALGDTYIWMFAMIGVFAIVMGVLCVYGIIQNNKGDKQLLKVRQRVFNNITAVFLMVAVVNVLYWNLFMFWEV